jgi:adenylate kinase
MGKNLSHQVKDFYMIIAITGTPGTGKTEVAKVLAKRLGWQYFSLNDIAEKENLYQGYDKERMCKIVDIEKLREEVNVLAASNKNMIIESHYAHDMPCDVVIVLRTEPSVLRKRMLTKSFHAEKVAENMEAEMMEVIKDEATAAHKNVYEIDTTKKTPDQAAKEIENIVRSQTFLAKDLKLPQDLIMDFRRPFGRVFSGEWDEAAQSVVKELKGKKGFIVTVGDPTSYYLIKHGLRPHMIIIDKREKRQKSRHKIIFAGKEIKAKNPPGHITVELWKAIENAIPELVRKKIKIFVKGEEDLAVLPCAIHLPLGSYIVYGQFDQGLVVVYVDEQKKERAKALLENIMFLQR